MTHVHESHPCFLHVLFLLHPPGLLDILEAGSLDDGECDEDHVGVGVGEGPHVFIVLLARRVANPGDTVISLISLGDRPIHRNRPTAA